jgi:hypothetical protein
MEFPPAAVIPDREVQLVNEFPYQVNGTCVAKGQKMPCM